MKVEMSWFLDTFEDDVEIEAFGAKAPWEYVPSMNYLEDWDHDGIPNYADHWFGPGAHNPVGFGCKGEDLDCEIEGNVQGVGFLDNNELSNFLSNDSELLSEGSFLIGNPEEDGQYWHMQEGENSCAIVAQEEILNALGINLNEEQLVQIAEEHDWYDEKIGTAPQNIGKLLEFAGVAVDREYDCGLEDLERWLQQGEKIIVGVNSQEIWNPIRMSSGEPVEQFGQGHAIQVTGISKGEDGIFIIANDSGIPDGESIPIAWDDFKNAWEDYGNFAVHTDFGGVNVA